MSVKSRIRPVVTSCGDFSFRSAQVFAQEAVTVGMNSTASSTTHPDARSTDLVLIVVLVASALAALAIGARYGALPLAAGAATALLAIGAAAYALARHTTLSMLTLAFTNAAMVALHIQLGRGTLEFHFGVFVLLGLLLVYRDWRPIGLAAGLFAVHHVLFDRLQALNYGVFCTPSANFLKTLMHAVYVVAQTG